MTDAEAETALGLLGDLGYDVDAVRTIRTYRVLGPADALPRLVARVLANDAIEQAVIGPLPFDRLGQGRPYRFARVETPIRSLDDDALVALSRVGQLYLSLDEMRTIRDHFRNLGREPTDCELETLAQTWSEHCSHKTLRGRVRVRRRGDRQPPQADDLQGDLGPGPRLARERLRRQCRRGPVRRRVRRLLQGGDT